jgi:hypothetical protein
VRREVAMPESVHEKFREMLDIHPMGCPPAPEIIEILKILFTEDEARVALGLGFRPGRGGIRSGRFASGIVGR